SGFVWKCCKHLFQPLRGSGKVSSRTKSFDLLGSRSHSIGMPTFLDFLEQRRQRGFFGKHNETLTHIRECLIEVSVRHQLANVVQNSVNLLLCGDLLLNKRERLLDHSLAWGFC